MSRFFCETWELQSKIDEIESCKLLGYAKD